MSNRANELLDGLSEEEIASYSAEPETEGHIVIDKDRIITVPESLKRIAVQYDHNIETVTFDCPRYWDGIDMSTMVVYINCETPAHTLCAYLAKNVRIDADDDTIMHFDWAITKDVTRAKGNLKFLVCINTTDEYGNEEHHWNSELNTEMYISEGLECADAVLEQYPAIVTQLLEEMTKTQEAMAAGAGVKSVEQAFESSEPNGINALKVTLTDGRVMQFNIRNGITPARGTDYWTPEDKQEIINSVLAELPRAEAISV